MSHANAIRADRFDAALFDLDGVLTPTATIHAAAWKRMFDDFLRARAEALDEPFVEFTDDDYRRDVDGKPRLEGVRGFLATRGIELPEGSMADPGGHATMHALGNLKNTAVGVILATEGVSAYPGSVALVDRLRADGVKTAVVSSSHNALAVLRSAGIDDRFDVRMDGAVAHERGIAGKPAPDTFLAAAADLGVAPDRAVVLEDAIAGVSAGRAGAFGLVIGVARGEGPEALLAAGADIVVADLGELLP